MLGPCSTPTWFRTTTHRVFHRPGRPPSPGGRGMSSSCVVIEPSAVYDDDALYQALGLSGQALSRARRSGELRFTRKGRRVLYLGSWVLAWLQAGGESDGAERSGRLD